MYTHHRPSELYHIPSSNIPVHNVGGCITAIRICLHFGGASAWVGLKSTLGAVVSTLHVNMAAKQVEHAMLLPSLFLIVVFNPRHMSDRFLHLSPAFSLPSSSLTFFTSFSFYSSIPVFLIS